MSSTFIILTRSTNDKAILFQAEKIVAVDPAGEVFVVETDTGSRYSVKEDCAKIDDLIKAARG